MSIGNTTDISAFIIAAIMAALPLPLLKSYNETKDNSFVIYAIVSYLILVIAYMYITSKHPIASVYPMLKVLSIMIVVFFGIVVYKEKLENYQIVGIVLGLISILLMYKY